MRATSRHAYCVPTTCLSIFRHRGEAARAGGTLHSVVMLHQQSEAQDLSRVHRNRALFADKQHWMWDQQYPDANRNDDTYTWGSPSKSGEYWYRDPSPDDEHSSCTLVSDTPEYPCNSFAAYACECASPSPEFFFLSYAAYAYECKLPLGPPCAPGAAVASTSAARGSLLGSVLCSTPGRQEHACAGAGPAACLTRAVQSLPLRLTASHCISDPHCTMSIGHRGSKHTTTHRRADCTTAPNHNCTLPPGPAHNTPRRRAGSTTASTTSSTRPRRRAPPTGAPASSSTSSSPLASRPSTRSPSRSPAPASTPMWTRLGASPSRGRRSRWRGTCATWTGTSAPR